MEWLRGNTPTYSPKCDQRSRNAHPYRSFSCRDLLSVPGSRVKVEPRPAIVLFSEVLRINNACSDMSQWIAGAFARS